jgi:hypothetical protein
VIRVFVVRRLTVRRECFFSFSHLMTHTGNASNLQCQEVGRRKGAKELVVIWAYSVALVWLV